MAGRLLTRAAVFGLAFLSFACLLGTFYGLRSMRWFGCWVVIPSTTALFALAVLGPHPARGWVREGALGGVVAAFAYDFYRLPFVLDGAPLFKVFPRFGELLLGADEPRWLVHAVGWLYHFSNGAALGMMLLAALPTTSRRWLFLGALAWALVVEATLLASRYAAFFGLPLTGRFVFLTASAHAVFGLALGGWLAWRVSRAPKRDTK
jgi:hypothetical protein